MMDRALLAICALLLNAALGGPRRLYRTLGLTQLLHAPARALREVERRLNREHRPVRQREMRGLLVAVAVPAGGLLLGWLCAALLDVTNRFPELFLLALALPLRPLWDLAGAVRKALLAGRVQAAREEFAGTSWRHHALLDTHGLARASIETLAVGFACRIVSPVFWYLLLGLPGLFMTLGVILIDETIAGRTGFARPARMAAELVHWLPSRLAAGLWIIAALFVPEGRIGAALASLRTPLVEASPQALMLAAAASVLGLSLGGPSSIYAAGAWVGSGTPKAMPVHVRQAQYLLGVLALLLIVLLGVIL